MILLRRICVAVPSCCSVGLWSDQLDRWDYAPAGGLLVSSRVNIVLLYRQ